MEGKLYSVIYVVVFDEQKRRLSFLRRLSKFNIENNFLDRYFYLNGFPNKFLMAIISQNVLLLRIRAIKVLTMSKKTLYMSILFASHKTNSAIKKELRVQQYS